MTKADIQNDLITTTDALQIAHGEVHAATTDLHNHRRALTTAEHKHTRAGLEGKNETARKAELAVLTTDETQDVELAEKSLRDAQHQLTLANLNHQLARNLLKLHTSNTQEADL